MSNRAHYVPTNFVASESDRLFGGGNSRLDSENEDLRGVIDDLTVENKRLRQMVKAQKRATHNTPSELSQQQDKLFEVRLHGLPAEKRRELEYLLRNFATSVHTNVPSKASATSNTESIPDSGLGISQGPIKTIRTDSGYGSNSNSGQAGSSIPTTAIAPRMSSNRRAVKTYLQDIPDTLLPKQNPVMSERAKMALTVRRLEQLFTGRNATPGLHDQPMQQQEISDSAARADRMQDARNNKKRKAEGNREAHVYPPDSRINLDAMEDVEPREPVKLVRDEATSGAASPDQRPTRPLDLDIHRAQVAADNISYIHHLGLSSPHFGGALREGEESPWMFLNLLSGLAQLHTLNVTPELIRKAIKNLSKRFELSKDGHKVRWVGNSDGTKFAAEDEKAIESAEINTHESTEDAATGGSSSRRSKTDSASGAAATSHATSEEKTSGVHTSSGSKGQLLTTSAMSNLQSSSIPTKTTTTSSAFDYKPILFRGKPQLPYHDETIDSDESLDTSSGDSSSLIDALNKSNLNQQAKEEGLITFYNNPYYCSDFSSDNKPPNMVTARPAIIGETLGIDVPADLVESPLRFHDATYFTAHFAPKPFDADALPAPERQKFDLRLPQLKLDPIVEAGEEETVPMNMEVCGLGGIYPEDNFAMDVKIQRSDLSTRGADAVLKTLPFSRRKMPLKFMTEVASCNKIDLLPSKLPPPSYIFFTSSSSSDADVDSEDVTDDEGDDSEGSSSPFVDEECPAPPAFLQQWSRSSGGEQGDDDDDDQSSEIDMLAIARRVNPEQIAEQERIYMMHQPSGAQRAVAGSLAATVGASRSSPSVSNRGGVTIASEQSDHGSIQAEISDYDSMSE